MLAEWVRLMVNVIGAAFWNGDAGTGAADVVDGADAAGASVKEGVEVEKRRAVGSRSDAGRRRID